MAVYTQVSAEQLGDLLCAFDLGALRCFEAIEAGVENSNYRLETNAGRFVLTLYEKRVDAADLPFFVGLMEHLQARGIPCPKPVRRRTGEAIGVVAGRPCAIVTFLDGAAVGDPAPHHVRAVGSMLARLHLAGSDFAPRRPNALSVPHWPALFAAARARPDALVERLGATIADELRWIAAAWPTGLPEGVVHADLFPDNVLFTGDRPSGVIDFYFACVDALAYDLAVCLNAWCFEPDGSFSIDRGRALLAGYESVRPLDRAEAETLPILCRGAALRFMLTRLVDWLNVPPGALVDPKDPMEFHRRLAFHRSVADVSAYGRIRPPARTPRSRAGERLA